MKRGLISEVDADAIERTLRRIMKDFPEDEIKTFEIGINSGETSRGIHEVIVGGWRHHIGYGIDNQQDFKMGAPYPSCHFIVGDSVQVCGQLKDNSFHFGFIDGNHAYHRVIADFVAYAPKILIGGYLVFHDTAPHIKDFKDYQQEGNGDHRNMYISVRRALTDICLLGSDGFLEWQHEGTYFDPKDEAGGVTIFKKIA